MKIVQINTHDIQGGAARAAYRLHKGLRHIGVDCKMLVRYKDSTDESVLQVIPHDHNDFFDGDFLNNIIQRRYINEHRTDISNTLFSLPYPGYDLTHLSLVHDSDIINLHWIAFYQSPLTLHKLFSLGKPVAWTLHDQWAFTGGCHYSAGCKKYCENCAGCPQLSDDPFDLPTAILKDKLDIFKGTPLTIVTPSRWLATCAKESRLFKDFQIEVIPNSLETDVFIPISKSEAKKRLNLAEETTTLLFGAQDGKEKRKGFRDLLAAIQHCKTNSDFQGLISSNKIKILSFGHPSDELEAMGLPIVSFGHIDSDEKLREVYSAADLFVLPSLEDNLPNTILESFSCGTPVIAFATGGIIDLVIPDVTGLLAPKHDYNKLGEAILTLIFNREEREIMGEKGRQEMVNNYSLETQAKHYLSLYEDLQKHKLSHAVPNALQSSIDDSEDNGPAEAALPVHLDTAVGPHLQKIYNQVLSKSLKEYSFFMQEKYQGDELKHIKSKLFLMEDALQKICKQFYREKRDLNSLIKVFRTQKIDFGTDEASMFLLSGWSLDEKLPDEGVAFNWATGRCASLFLSLPKNKDAKLTVNVKSPHFPKPQKVTVKVDGNKIGSWQLNSNWEWEKHSVIIKPENHREGVSLIKFGFSKNLKTEQDPRPLAVLFGSLTLT